MNSFFFLLANTFMLSCSLWPNVKIFVKSITVFVKFLLFYLFLNCIKYYSLYFLYSVGFIVISICFMLFVISSIATWSINLSLSIVLSYTVLIFEIIHKSNLKWNLLWSITVTLTKMRQVRSHCLPFLALNNQTKSTNLIQFYIDNL